MKVSDDYKAKVRLWAERPTVMPLPPPPRLPRFAAQRFSSHAEMNRWKQALFREVAETLPPHG
jgi:hypothetical protein